MQGKADKPDLRLRIVKHAGAFGIKSTVRIFETTPATVQKWLNRYRQERLAGLDELPRIPVRAWSYNSDVETVHRTIEDEFYELENFQSIKDYYQQVASYQAYYSLVRANMNKDYLSPCPIIKKEGPRMDILLARLPPLMLDWLGPDYQPRKNYC